MNRDQCMHPVVDEHGQCEWCHATIATEPIVYERKEPTTHEEAAHLRRRLKQVVDRLK